MEKLERNKTMDEVFGLKRVPEVEEVKAKEEEDEDGCEYPPVEDGDTITPQQFEEYVRVAAYFDYLKRPYGSEGTPEEDWAKAEKEIESRFHISSGAFFRPGSVRKED
jgi:hypothetical protein